MRAALSRQPNWARWLVVYAVSRLYSTALLWTLFAVATAAGWDFASHRTDASFFTFSGSWDGSFYRRIAEQGYPTEAGSDGMFPTDDWAFLPVYPAIVRALMEVTGLSFYPLGVAVSLVSGAVAALALGALVDRVADTDRANWSVALFAFGPFGFLLQATYAEALYLALVFGALALMVRRRYLTLLPLGVVAAFTRPGALALALTLAIVLVTRWRELRGTQRMSVVAAGMSIAIAGLSWPVIAGLVTGAPDAYLATELAFWKPLVGEVERFVPLTPWFLLAATWLGGWGVVLVVAVLAAAFLWFARRRIRSLGVEVHAYGASYALYLVAVFLPQQSIARLLLPLAPLLADPAVAGNRRWRPWLLGAGVLLQAVAVVGLWFLTFP